MVELSKYKYHVYICEEERNVIKREYNTKIIELDPKQKLINKKNIKRSSAFLVLATSNCELPGNYEKISDNLYSFNKTTKPLSFYRKLARVNCVRAIDTIEKPKLHSRFLRSYSHSSNIDYQIHLPLQYNAKSIFHQYKITGEGECASIVDTGLDHNSCWFFDPRIAVTEGCVTVSHRKVISYQAYADFEDSPGGHGTFLAGIVAGKASCPDPTDEFCSGSFYDGVAPDARLVIQDVFKTGSDKMYMPDNITHMVSLPDQIGCGAQLHAWSFPCSRFITNALDKLAYEHPRVVQVFAAGDEGDEMRSPGDSKNVLTVGAAYGPSVGLGQVDRAPAVKITIDSKATIIGFCDRFAGVSLLDAMTRTDISDATAGYMVGSDAGNAFLDDSGDVPLAELENAGIVLAFHNKPFVGRPLNTSVIRVNSRHLPRFKTGAIVQISPFNEMSHTVHEEGKTAPYSKGGYVEVGRRKPEIVMPAGPAHGPMARYRGSGACGTDGTMVGEGTSVAAAFATGDLLLLRQWIRNGMHPYGRMHKGSIMEFTSDLARAILANIARREPGMTEENSGFGVPQLDRFIILPDQYDNYDGLYGMRATNRHEILNGTAHMFNFTAEESGTLRVTLAWMDPPIDPMSTYVGSKIKLDLRVQCPDGKVYAGNRKEPSPRSYDTFSTLKGVEVEVMKGEKYFIYVISKNLERSPIKYSIAYSGPFNHFSSVNDPFVNLAPNPPCAVKCIGSSVCTRGWCKCPPGFYGDSCGETYIKGNLSIANYMNVKRYKTGRILFNIKKWGSGSKGKILIEEKNGKHFDYLIGFGRAPTFEDSDCNSHQCPYERDIDGWIIFNYDVFDSAKFENTMFLSVYSEESDIGISVIFMVQD